MPAPEAQPPPETEPRSGQAPAAEAHLPVPVAAGPPSLPAPHPVPHRRPWRAALLGLLLLAGAGYLAMPRLLGPEVPAMPVLRGHLVQSVVATGRVENPHRVSVGTQIAGTVAAIPVERGQSVAAGQLLIQLDDREARATAEQAEAALSQAEARIRQIRDLTLPAAEQSLRQADAVLDAARQAYGRTERLQAGGFATPAQLDEARRALFVAEAVARGARLQVENNRPGGTETGLAETTLRQAKATLGVARTRLDYTRIAAPVAGTLIRRDVEPGDAVQPGRVLMLLSPAEPTEIVLQLDERNLGLVRVGQTATVAADAYPDRPFPALLGYVNPGVDATRASVEVRLRVPAPPAFMRQDMTVSADILVAERAGALILPAEALLPGPATLVVRDGHVHRRPLRLGLQGRRGVEVLDGLQEGDLVLPASLAAGLQDGARVRPRTP
ncbi:efflux RND transporter periplasmic adaptor subunit [Paracraurococcus lichenis]|uniref:Efflux RND transporter periplasmic adaptor subunit n=1 Tax=Paracraurococcus lichenis TaxID=3064888 RepID=A0ABT9DW45_9PROT|nr:efflux RND transporter periplasmic adaptor subunit [Paracraurococcus sp. LOR1-02]MDO9708121.1 efflux RND transporter periplasmic adaptor subunit [Paracraurococcus sp. LOR1-02]